MATERGIEARLLNWFQEHPGYVRSWPEVLAFATDGRGDDTHGIIRGALSKLEVAQKLIRVGGGWRLRLRDDTIHYSYYTRPGRVL